MHSKSAAADSLTRPSPVLALLPWGLAIEDFLDPNGLSLVDFCREFTGSWMFGYAEALRSAGVETIIFCVSSGISDVVRTTHLPTGTPLCLMPLPRTQRLLRTGMRNPYGRTVAQTFRVPTPLRQLLWPPLFAAKEVAPFFATPIRTLAHELKDYSCDAVLVQEYEFPRFDVSVAVGGILGLPVFARFGGGDYQRWRLERLVRPRTLGRASGLIISSSSEVERVRTLYGVPPDKIAAIPKPIDLRGWVPGNRAEIRSALGISRSARVAAWHGRIDLWKKGLDTLVEAWAIITAERPDRDLALLLVGGGADVATVRRLLIERKLLNVVWIDRLIHDRSRIAELISAADVYAFPSRHEGVAGAPLEAMACGLPVVAADVSGMRDVLAGGEASGGVIVAQPDAFAFAKELGRMLDDEPLSRAVGAAARRRAETFDSELVGRQLRDFLFARRKSLPAEPPVGHRSTGQES